MMKDFRKKMKKLVERAAVRAAMADANTACPCITYQPKLPEAVKKLSRK